MRISKYLKLDSDVLLEWIYDDDNFLTQDYRIVIDTLNDTRFFSNTETSNTLPSITNNNTVNQLFPLDRSTNKWGIVDPDPDTNRYLFLQFQKFSGNTPFRYDVLRIHFPVNYTFKDKLGFLLNIELYNKTQEIKFPISNYHFDKSDASRTNEMKLSSPPFLFQEKLWGKYIELQIPSPYALTRDYTVLNNGVNIPKEGSIHKNIVEEDFNAFSTETPVNISFSFLTKKDTKLKQEFFLTSEPFKNTLPVTPEFENLACRIEHSTEGDFFEFYGIFNKNISEFNTFLKNKEASGNRHYILYEINVYEKNMNTDRLEFFVSEDYTKKISYRPIIKYSTTTAVIQLTMKIVNTVDDSVIVRKASYSMLQEEVGKYSKRLTKINLNTANKPKVYNSKPDQIVMNSNFNTKKTEKVRVPYAVMYERYNILTKNNSEQVNDTLWYGLGQNQILLYPSDNIVKFMVGKGTNQEGIEPFSIPENTPVFLTFKSNNKIVESPLFYDSEEIDLTSGSLVFRVMENQISTIKDINREGYDQFYIVLKPSNGTNTVLYAGRFLLYDA